MPMHRFSAKHDRRVNQTSISVDTFIRFHRLRYPFEPGSAEVKTFLDWLADERQVASVMRKRAWSDLLFRHTKVSEITLH